jgi:hypothetical protein
MARKLTPEQQAEVYRMYVENRFKCEYIGALFGIRRESVSKLALRRGAPKRGQPKGPRNRTTQEQICSE